jgi:hypothetical protein
MITGRVANIKKCGFPENPQSKMQKHSSIVECNCAIRLTFAPSATLRAFKMWWDPALVISCRRL